MGIQVKKYTAKPVVVEAVQVTSENMAEVAKWCKGQICTEAVPAEKSATGEAFTERYVKPKMYRPPTVRKNNREVDEERSKGYVGKWIIKRGTNFQVYTDQAFANSYTDNQAIPLAEQHHRDEVSPSIFDGMVQEMTQPARETHLTVPGHPAVFTTPARGVPMRNVDSPPAGVPLREFPKRTLNEIGDDQQARQNALFIENVPTGFEKPAN